MKKSPERVQQEIADLEKKLEHENSAKKKSPWTSWGAILLYVVLFFFCVEFVLRLYRLPWTLGLGVLLLIVLIKWGLPSLWSLIKENNELKQREKDRSRLETLKKMQNRSV